MVLRKSFYIRWSAGRSPRVHEVNPGRDPSHTVLAEMLSHVLIGWGFTTSLLDDTYMSYLGISFICWDHMEFILVVHIVLIEMMSHVIFLGFIMFLLDVILGHTL